MNPSSTEKPVASTPNTPDGAVAVGEVAALGRAAAHEQHRRDGNRGDDRRDQRQPRRCSSGDATGRPAARAHPIGVILAAGPVLGHATAPSGRTSTASASGPSSLLARASSS